MAIQKFQLANEKEYLETRQILPNFAVGVVPKLGDDVLLIKRTTQPSLGKYTIVLGKVWTSPITETSTDVDWWGLYLAQISGEPLKNPYKPALFVEGPMRPAVREFYEELFSDKKDVIQALNEKGNNELAESLMNKHDFQERMDVIDTTTGYCLKIYSANLLNPEVNSPYDTELLRNVELKNVNPLTQFILWKLGLSKEGESEIKYATVGKVKDLYSWKERPNAFTIEY